MKHSILKVPLVVFAFLLQNGIRAQQSLNTSGGDLSGTNGSVNYSVGQVFYTTPVSANGSVAQGVQQPYEISVVTGLEQASGILLSCSVYPNPTTDFLNLSIGNYNIKNLYYQLYDGNSKLIEDKKITTENERISLVELATGIYFVKVREDNQELKTFKIIKH